MILGRDVVLRAAEQALDAALGGRGGLVLVSGEAGIGKTTVARAIADSALDRGALVRWGACWEGQVALPLGVWIDCLRQPGGDACEAAAARFEQGDFAPGVDSDAAERARSRFFEAVVDALRETSAARPQVLVLDDVHWADQASLRLLQSVAARVASMPVLAVATYRDEELPTGSLASIGGAERLLLTGLADDAVEALLADILGRAPTATEVRSVVDQTGGNPLFVTQVARLVAAGSPARLPTGVREVLARRLARVSPECDHVLGAAAVVGAEFETDVVRQVAGTSADVVLAALDEAAMSGLVSRREDADRWAFVHALVRAARYDALGSGERAEMHRRALDALGDRRSVPTGALLHHAASARLDPTDPRPAELAVAAAREALGRLAWEEASALCAQAMARAPEGPGGDIVRAEAWLAAGDARLRGGDADAAGDAFGAAAAIARERGDADLLARAALGFGAGLGGFEVRVLEHRQIELLEEAAAALPEESPLRPPVLARLSVALAFVGSDERRLALADEAIAGARQLRDGRALAAAIAARCDAIAGPDHVTERLGAASEIVALAQRASDLPLELLGRRLRVVALLELRDLPGFEAEVTAYAKAADRLGDPLYAWYVPTWRAMLALADGHRSEAIALADEARAIGASAGSENSGLLRAAFRVFEASDRGDVAGMEAGFADLVALNPDFLNMYASAFRAMLDHGRGLDDEVRAQLDRDGVASVDGLALDQEWLTSLGQYVIGAAGCHHEPVLRRCYELLLPYAGVGVFEGIAAVDHGTTDRFLALAAGYLGDGDAANAHTDAALAAVVGAGRLVVAHTLADCARGLAATGRDEDVARAGELARRAMAAYQDLGLEVRAEALRTIAHGPAAPASVAPEGADIAALVREGDAWAVTFAGTTVRVRHTKGVADLAVLLARADREVHVRELERVPAGASPAAAQPALDERAVAEYRRRLRDLEADLEEADRHADSARAAKLAAERDALVDELTSAFGLSGRRREAGPDPDERLRKAVSARVKAAIDRLDGLHPDLGRHLRNAVRTGFWCSYRPERPVTWQVEPDRSP